MKASRLLRATTLVILLLVAAGAHAETISAGAFSVDVAHTLTVRCNDTVLFSSDRCVPLRGLGKSAPSLVGAFATGAEFPATSTDSVWIGDVETPSFVGTLAIVAVRLCDTSERNRWGSSFRGLAVYDVSDPAATELLGRVDTGPGTQGVHEIDAAQRLDGTVVVAATVMQSLLHTGGEIGDLRLVEGVVALVVVHDQLSQLGGPGSGGFAGVFGSAIDHAPIVATGTDSLARIRFPSSAVARRRRRAIWIWPTRYVFLR